MNPTLQFLRKKNVSCVFANDPYTPKEKRMKKIIETTSVRSVSPNEIIIEVDSIGETFNQDYVYKVQENNAKHLKEIGFEVHIFDHGGKSPYLRMYDFESMSRDNQKKFFKLLVQQELEPLQEGYSYDESFYSKFHWCPLEFQPHWKPKYNDNKHKLIKVLNEGNKNKVSDKVLEEIKTKPEHGTSTNFAPGKCKFLDYAIENSLPDGSNRNKNVLPNLVAMFPDECTWKHCAVLWNKNYAEFEGWAKQKPEFNCIQLRKYAENIGKSSICDLCLLGGECNGKN